VSDAAGVIEIIGGTALALVTVFALWRRVPGAIALAAVTVGGLLVAAGALVVQDGVTAAEWVVTLVVLGVLTPVHARLVFGEPGERG